MPIQSRPSEEENERMMSSDLDSAESELKLSDILAVWWKTRVRIFLLALAGGVVAAAALLVAFLLRPSQQVATVDVRLLFSGVDKGQYPNGTPFSAQDIVATSILQQVYEQNNLGKFIKFDDFKSSFSVLESNEATERLRREYGPKLDDRRLTSPERSKIEDEFQGKLKSSRTGEFRLVGLLGSGLTNWNRDLVGIVMNDILNTWVLDARGKGVFKFDLNVYSENIISDLETYQEDQLVFIDRLRVTISRIIQNIRALEEIPGARLLRVGDRKLSLGELDVALQDDLRFKIGEFCSGHCIGIHARRDERLLNRYKSRFRELWIITGSGYSIRLSSNDHERGMGVSSCRGSKIDDLFGFRRKLDGFSIEKDDVSVGCGS